MSKYKSKLKQQAFPADSNPLGIPLIIRELTLGEANAINAEQMRSILQGRSFAPDEAEGIGEALKSAKIDAAQMIESGSLIANTRVFYCALDETGARLFDSATDVGESLSQSDFVWLSGKVQELNPDSEKKQP